MASGLEAPVHLAAVLSTAADSQVVQVVALVDFPVVAAPSVVEAAGEASDK